MTRITLVAPADATGSVGQTLTDIKSAFGVVPNMFRAVANSPAALASMWGSFGALGGGRLGARLGEQIAVAIADRNNCNYCLAAHTVLGQRAGASAQEMAEAQGGRSTDPRTPRSSLRSKWSTHALTLLHPMSTSCAPRVSMTAKWSRSSRMSRSTCSPTTSMSRSTCPSTFPASS